MFDMENMSKMLEGMQGNADKLKSELEQKTYSVKTGGGLVELSVNGSGEVIDLLIDDELLSDKSSLEILLIGAINDANKMVQTNQQQSAMGMLNSMGNPFSGTK
ncbi:YbaB/EbfC family nucleoid-associated protein [Sulfurimonas sp.]|jgi:DNA-binding YbaB/EbfC family protein|uniref:YbaB/EbfC family nucleoid-associated protein n=1 Tax=Sulfurimonas sp. TaxID=2022749 RepID=UPI0025F886E6|nr:YbaB/EbfC family nucleoid-associated protein [Sulfurimonas sp.]MBT5935258.1 YbaB/EbfC family nucleoid-associated protein [Sulfurimonas sp.]